MITSDGEGRADVLARASGVGATAEREQNMNAIEALLGSERGLFVGIGLAIGRSDALNNAPASDKRRYGPQCPPVLGRGRGAGRYLWFRSRISRKLSGKQITCLDYCGSLPPPHYFMVGEVLLGLRP